MKIEDLVIVIENLRGSYKKFADTLEEYPVLGVTFPTHYGYIQGYIGEDRHDLDIFVGSGDLMGYIKMERDDVDGGIETKMFLKISEDELSEIEERYKPVLAGTQRFNSEQEFLEHIQQFKDKSV